jgi:acetylglutamate kinase
MNKNKIFIMTKVQYILNEKGEKSSVVLSMAQWDRMQQKMRKQEILLGMKSALQEIKTAKKKGTKLQSLSDFINECRGIY